MSPTAQQIESAWRLLEDGSAMEEVRASWTQLTRIRRELDDAIVALAHRIEQLRAVAAEPKVEEPAEDPKEETS